MGNTKRGEAAIHYSPTQYFGMTSSFKTPLLISIRE